MTEIPLLLTVEEGLRFQGAQTGMKLRVVLDTWKVLPRYWRTFVRGSFTTPGRLSRLATAALDRVTCSPSRHGR